MSNLPPATVGLPILLKDPTFKVELAVSLAEAKAHLRVDTGDDDRLIESLIRTAQDYVGMHARLSLTHERWILRLPSMDNDWVEIPRRPLFITGQMVSKGDVVLFVAGNRPDADWLQLSTDEYLILVPHRGGAVEEAPLEASPLVKFRSEDDAGKVTVNQWAVNGGNYQAWDGNPPLLSFDVMPDYIESDRFPVEIRFTAGYSKDHTGVPAGLKQVVLLLVGSYYMNREAVGPNGGPVPYGVDMLLKQFSAGDYN